MFINEWKNGRDGKCDVILEEGAIWSVKSWGRFWSKSIEFELFFEGYVFNSEKMGVLLWVKL